MAAASTPASSLLHSSCSSSSAGRRISSPCSFSSSAVVIPRNAIFGKIGCAPQLGLIPFAQWSGLKSSGISISRFSVKLERKGKRKSRGIYASLFGVGAPEVLVIGVVALLVFGPKGLAEVARNMGKTIRAFQPTIKELQEVSREFKSTLEREIGLDDPLPSNNGSNTTQAASDGSEANAKPETVDPVAQERADWLRGALDQLQKEQEEEKQQEEIEKAQSEADLRTTSEDGPQASDMADEEASSSSVSPPSENPNKKSLQEAGSVPQTDTTAPKLEAEI
ncbi:sec-independent protein translocase protein TATB, chloroplastic-like [Andrographis paniculata]|uniref:sec-independent protein translocase protein TATB, chloroplastic-like n=1 Tax=Andrographis paniculata TaxID=175694 RepID=UPI0021E89E22|nr:sec-independent protein translocase protein TATB, chloroplastic-like [Andrographis paniculata]